MSKIFVDQVDPKTGTSLTLGTSGDTVNIPSGVTLANAGTVTGLPASAISSGTIATARLGSGTASSSTFLRGDQTYAAAGGGKIGQVLQQVNATEVSISNDSATNGVATGLTLAITPSASSSKILVIANIYTNIVDGRGYGIHIMRGTTEIYEDNYHWGAVLPNGATLRSARAWHYLDSPNTTSATTYAINASTESANTVYFQANTNQSTLTLMEVLA